MTNNVPEETNPPLNAVLLVCLFSSFWKVFNSVPASYSEKAFKSVTFTTNALTLTANPCL